MRRSKLEKKALCDQLCAAIRASDINSVGKLLEDDRRSMVSFLTTTRFVNDQRHRTKKTSSNGATPLIVAVQENKAGMVSLLLKAGMLVATGHLPARCTSGWYLQEGLYSPHARMSFRRSRDRSEPDTYGCRCQLPRQDSKVYALTCRL